MGSYPSWHGGGIAGSNIDRNYAANTLTYAVFDANIKRADVVAFIDRLAQHYQDSKLTFAVLDNTSIHRHIDEEKIRTWLCDYHLILFPLPRIAPNST